MKRFSQVKQILDAAVGGPAAGVGGPHGAFWRSRTRDQLVAFKILGLPIITLGHGDDSNMVKALRAQVPFGQDVGTPGATIDRMPAGRDPVPPDQIAIIAAWIDDNCPDDDADPLGPLEVTLGGAVSGSAFLIAANGGSSFATTLSLRTTDGSIGDVVIRAKASSAASLQFGASAVHVSGDPVEVEVSAATTSGAGNDTTIEVVQGAAVLASVDLTAISAPALRFRGRFQCRLATDPDAFDDPWGHNSSFGVYAVQGPDPAHPDEPPLDRIIRFSDPVALRPFCAPIGVAVTGVEAQVGGTSTLFDAGDAAIGQPVRLGPGCVFDGRNRAFAPDGFEPIADFRLEIGAGFTGASAPAVARPSPNDPPGSTAPYANGIIQLDADPSGGVPGDFGLQATTWAENAWSVLAVKLARLVAQQPADAKATRLRDRRLQAHADTRPGHGLGALATPLVFMERYTGLIDREVTVDPLARGILAYLRGLPAIRVTLDFLGFDTDCQTGSVTGTLDAPSAAGPLGLVEEAPHTALRRVPLDEQ